MTEMRTRDGDTEDNPAENPAVTAHECSRERIVFTEDGNTEAWIATDTTISLDR